MSASGPARQCPRCGTLLYEEMPFCRACGWQFAPEAHKAAPASALSSEFIPYDGPAQPEDVPLAQEDFTPQHQPGSVFPNQASYSPPTQPGWAPPTPGVYPPQGQWQAGPAAYAPAPTPPRTTSRTRALLLIALMVLLVGAAAGGIFLNFHTAASTASSPPIFDRHGLQNNVPLPDNTAFQYKHTLTQGTLTADEWIWKVNKSEPVSIEQFYQSHLPSNGWTHIQTIQGDTLGVVGCQGGQVLVVGISKHLHDSSNTGTSIITDAPAGGSALGIALTSNQALVQSYCQSTQP